MLFRSERAEKLAPGLDWEKPPLADPDNAQDDTHAEWFNSHPTNFWALTQLARKLIEEKKWREAQAPLKRLIELYPSWTGPDNAYWLLAQTHRALNETHREVEALTRLADRDAEAPDAYLRLMELAAMAQDWRTVSQIARRFLAVNPLVAPPYRHLAQASEALGETQPAIDAYRTLLRLDPPNPAEVHFHLAQLLHQTGDASARRHVLQALEEAPRYRAALRLLLELSSESSPTKAGAAADTAEAKP